MVGGLNEMLEKGERRLRDSNDKGEGPYGKGDYRRIFFLEFWVDSGDCAEGINWYRP